MAVSILFELNQELTRLFAAGSRLATGDPRLKKYSAPLKKYGERAPVFLKLAAMLDALVETDKEGSARKLIETEAFLLSVLSTQGDTSPPPEEKSAALCGEKPLAPAKAGYRALLPLIGALSASGAGRMEMIKEAHENGVFGDPRLFKAAARSLGDKNFELAEYMAETVLPSMGEDVWPDLAFEYDQNGGAKDGRCLVAMHGIRGEGMLGLVEEAARDGSVAVKISAVRIMSGYEKYEETLRGMLDERKEVREEAEKAIKRLNSKGFFKKGLKKWKMF